MVEENLSVTKTISVGVSFSGESSRKMTKQSGIHTFNLKFKNVNYDGTNQAFSQKEEEENEEKINLASHDGDFVSLTHVQR